MTIDTAYFVSSRPTPDYLHAVATRHIFTQTEGKQDIHKFLILDFGVMYSHFVFAFDIFISRLIALQRL